MTYVSASTLLSFSHGRHACSAPDGASNLFVRLLCVLCEAIIQDCMDDAGVRYQEALEQSGRLSAMKFGDSTKAARPCS